MIISIVHDYNFKSLTQNIVERSMLQSTSLSKSFVYLLFTLTLIDMQLAITLIILQGVMGYTGFDQSKIIVTTCSSQPYKTAKFIALYQMMKVSFITTIIIVACQIVIFIVCLIWLVRVCRQKQSSNVSTLIGRNTKIFLYLIGSINLLAAIPIFGYYLTFVIQIPLCDSYTFSNNSGLTIAIIAAIYLFVSLVLFILFLYIIFKEDSEQKYKEIEKYQTYQTEPAEKVEQSKSKPKEIKNHPYQNKYNPSYEIKQHPPYENKQNPLYENKQNPPASVFKNERSSPSPPPPPPKVYVYQADNTQQNLFQSSTKKALAISHNKQTNKEVVPQQSRYKSPIQKYVYQKNPQPKQYSKIPSNNTPGYYIPPQSQHKLSPPKPSEISYNKNRGQLNRDDHDSFKNEEQRYLSKYGGPILPSSGVSQVENRDKKKDFDFYNSPSKKNQNESPPNHGGREGVLAKYIRGKYAN